MNLNRPKYIYCIFLKGLCWVSICWILNNALCSMSWMFWFLLCAPLCHQHLAPYAVLSWRCIFIFINSYNFVRIDAIKKENQWFDSHSNFLHEFCVCYGTVLCCTVLWCTALCSLLHCVHHCTVLYCTALCFTAVQSCTVICYITNL